ncbi:hypothetical protein V6N13_110494 [Hibiscus sabdariffa]
MPNDWHNLLEVPGNRLPETGSRKMNFCILEVPGNRLPNTGSNMAEELKEKEKKRRNLLRRLEARFVKQLKRLRYYNSNIGFMPGMINQAEYGSSSISAVKSCTEATWSIKTQNLSRQSTSPDFLPRSISKV